jgi:hypothetical protein
MKLLSLSRLLSSLVMIAGVALAQPPVPQPKTTNVLVILTAKPGVTPDRIAKIMPAEIRATVRLYLDGKIQQWYSRGDGRGVVFLLASTDVEEARALIDALPLSKENLMDHEYLPVGPLLPLTGLLRDAPPQ